jgi:ribosomal protein S18 acetylase RimI-like enzyme
MQGFVAMVTLSKCHYYLCNMAGHESIERATSADIPQLEKLINQAYRGEEAKKGWTHEAELIEGEIRTDASSLQELMQDPHSVILKYEVGETILGCVYLQKQDHALYLGMLSVSPAKQSKGIGKKLLAAADEYAHSLGAFRIEMTVISSRKELIDWYKRHGYKETGMTKPFPSEKKFGVPRQPLEFMILEKNLDKDK